MLLMLDKLDLMLNRHQQLHSNWFLSYWIWISLWRWVWILIWLRCLNVRLNLYILMDHIHKQLLLVLLLGQRLDLLDKAKQLDNPLDLLVLHRLLNWLNLERGFIDLCVLCSAYYAAVHLTSNVQPTVIITSSWSQHCYASSPHSEIAYPKCLDRPCDLPPWERTSAILLLPSTWSRLRFMISGSRFIPGWISLTWI